LVTLNESAELVEKFRMASFQPLEQSPRIMKADADPGMLGKESEEWRVGFPGCSLKDVVEVPHWLVRVDDQGQ